MIDQEKARRAIFARASTMIANAYAEARTREAELSSEYADTVPDGAPVSEGEILDIESDEGVVTS
jgi:hypothetical protein